MTNNGQTYYLHYDQVGSLRAVSDTSGSVVKEIVYDTYGNILSDSNPGMKVPFGFAGGLYDGDTGLTRFGYRDYDSFTGKWTAKDPIGFAGGDSNLYGYVLGDPVNFVDPNGLSGGVIPLPWPVYLGLLLWYTLDLAWDNNIGDEIVCWAKPAKQDNKTKANNPPDWVKRTGLRPDPNQKCQDFAKQLLDAKYGVGKWPKGPGTEYNQIVKWCQRSLK